MTQAHGYASPSWWQWPTFAPCEDRERISPHRANTAWARQHFGPGVIAELVIDPEQRYGPHSVRVDVGGATVGYVYQSTQVEWHAAVSRLGGARALVRANVNGDPTIDASFTRHDPARGFLYGSSSVTVKVQPEHQAWLRSQVPPRTGTAATLIPHEESLVVVVGGYSVGTLSTKAATTKYLPLAAACIERGFGAGCWMLAQDSKDGAPKFRVKLVTDVATWSQAIAWTGSDE